MSHTVTALDEELQQQTFELELLYLSRYRARVGTPLGTVLEILAPPGSDSLGTGIFRQNYTVKDLGIQVRTQMGLPGYTQTHQTTRVMHQGQELPMHRPIASLDEDNPFWHETMHWCIFCHKELLNKANQRGPFRSCWFCQDAPSWHHGHCCPHNPCSRNWNGKPHKVQHQMNIRSFLKSLPFK